MSVLARNRWLRRLGLAAVAALCFGALTLPTAPADARVFVDIGVPVPGYYYAPPAPYYPAPAAYAGCGWGFHWVPPHWDRWGRWVPGHCRPNY
jgi:hypothetical protein